MYRAHPGELAFRQRQTYFRGMGGGCDEEDARKWRRAGFETLACDTCIDKENVVLLEDLASVLCHRRVSRSCAIGVA